MKAAIKFIVVRPAPREEVEEPPDPEFDPGPECDDIGGMSEDCPMGPDEPNGLYTWEF